MTNLSRGILLAVLAAPAAAATEAPPPSGLDTRVTVEVKHVPLTTFLDTLSAQAKINFIVSDGLEDKRLTAFLHGVTVKDALDVLKELKGVDYRRLGRSNTYLMAPKGSAFLRAPATIDGSPALDQRVTVHVKNAPLEQFLDTLSAQTKTSFILAEGLEGMRVTAQLDNVTAREALEILLSIKGLTCRRLGVEETRLIEQTEEPAKD